MIHERSRDETPAETSQLDLIDELILRVKRAESAPTRALRRTVERALRSNVPVAGPLRPAYGALYRSVEAFAALRELCAGKFLWEPMVRARFARVGAGLQLTALPFIRGHARITVGDHCRFGYFSVATGRFVDRPELSFGDRVTVCTEVRFVVNKRIHVGDDVAISPLCWISDTDGHPSDLERRERGETLREDDIEPLIIEDRVWIGHGAHVLKGVTLGRGCVVAAGSVVIRDVPPGALAMGVPARVLTRW